MAVASLASAVISVASEHETLLACSPLLARPTRSSITINLIAAEEPIACAVQYRPASQPQKQAWKETGQVIINPFATANLCIEGLLPDTAYEYQVVGRLLGRDQNSKQASGQFRTQRVVPSPFSFAILSDAHITPFDADRMQVLLRTSQSVASRKPDLMLMLGDNIQTFVSHGGPLGKKSEGPQLYLSLRRSLGDLPSQVSVFSAIGNWEGENGWHPPQNREWAREARTAFLPNPDAKTYPEGGSIYEDYYAFTWGDALFVVLNPLTYTVTDHTLQTGSGRADDWTLGETQKKWVLDQLSRSKARWKLIFLHHTVGGNAGNEVNSRYGRGGGRAAHVGEQALLHGWMRKFGVQALFYGHDHVFTDNVVDGIHYTCVGSAGAPWKFGTAETGYETYWTPSGYTFVTAGTDDLTVSFIRPDEHVGEGVAMHTFVIQGGRRQ